MQEYWHKTPDFWVVRLVTRYIWTGETSRHVVHPTYSQLHKKIIPLPHKRIPYMIISTNYPPFFNGSTKSISKKVDCCLLKIAGYYDFNIANYSWLYNCQKDNILIL